VAFGVKILLNNGEEILWRYRLNQLVKFLRLHRKPTSLRQLAIPVLPWIIDMTLSDVKPMLTNKHVIKIEIEEGRPCHTNK